MTKTGMGRKAVRLVALTAVCAALAIPAMTGSAQAGAVGHPTLASLLTGLKVTTVAPGVKIYSNTPQYVQSFSWNTGSSSGHTSYSTATSSFVTVTIGH